MPVLGSGPGLDVGPQLDRENHTKDIDFNPSGITQRWDAGYAHTRAALDRSRWTGEFDPLSGVILHEHPEVLSLRLNDELESRRPEPAELFFKRSGSGAPSGTGAP